MKRSIGQRHRDSVWSRAADTCHGHVLRARVAGTCYSHVLQSHRVVTCYSHVCSRAVVVQWSRVHCYLSGCNVTSRCNDGDDRPPRRGATIICDVAM